MIGVHKETTAIASRTTDAAAPARKTTPGGPLAPVSGLPTVRDLASIFGLPVFRLAEIQLSY
jgi:hypothetical protein